MNHSFMVKQVAKEITLLRHLPEQRAYEIQINWHQEQAEPVTSIHYLPEIFLYPYALKNENKTQSTKICQYSVEQRQQGEDTTFCLETRPNLTYSHCPVPKNNKQNTRLGSKRLESLLDYDQLYDNSDFKQYWLNRNQDVVKLRQLKENKKKRKT